LENKYTDIEGNIFDIKRMTLNDGPGIRTTIFLKGCNMNCKWCHNPESINSNMEIMFDPNKCIGCKTCENICHREVHKFIGSKHIIDRDKCNICRKCIEFCPTKAIEIIGSKVSVKYVVEIVNRDKTFYDSSNGGVTISGGEPLMQKEFTFGLLYEAKNLEINTVLDTNGYWKWSDIKDMLPYIDIFRYDLKIMDNVQHKVYTNKYNKIVLENLVKLSTMDKNIVIVIPFIRGINDSNKNIDSMIMFLRSLPNIPKIKLIPYHTLYSSKLKKLNKEYELFPMSKQNDIERIKNIFSSKGIEVCSN